jgi:hypothetical protein
MRIGFAAAAIVVLGLAGAAPARAQPMAAVCNGFAADTAAGHPRAPYPVSRERAFMEAYKHCMRVHHDLVHDAFRHLAILFGGDEPPWPTPRR